MSASADRFLLHFDVDVVDEAMTYLAVLPDATGGPG